MKRDKNQGLTCEYYKKEVRKKKKEGWEILKNSQDERQYLLHLKGYLNNEQKPLTSETHCRETKQATYKG